WLSLITSLTPRRPRSVRDRRNLVQKGSASDGPTVIPRTSRRPSAFAPTAIITATDMILPPSRTFTYVASINTYGHNPSIEHERNVLTRSSISSHSRET